MATAGAPALGQRAPARLDIYFGDVTVAVGHSGLTGSPVLHASEPVEVASPTMTYDTSGLIGVATVSGEYESDCEVETPERLVCSSRSPLEIDRGGIGGVLPVRIKAANGARAGDSGELRIIFSATGVQPVSVVSTVRVGDAVDLAVTRRVKQKAKPGARFTPSITVRNGGDKVVDGVAAAFYSDYDFRSPKRYRNCTYLDGQLETCRFDQRLRPGARYRVEVPYQLRPDAYAPGFDATQVRWQTAAEHEDYVKYLTDSGYPIGERGAGPVLKLTEVTGAAGLPQADTDDENNWTMIEVDVTGRNGADLAAVGDTVTGVAGDTVTARVGVLNKGPASIDWGRSGEAIAWVRVDIPAGTTAVRVPSDCRPVDGDWSTDSGKPGQRRYTCPTYWLLAVGKPVLYDFELRIDKVVPNATGRVFFDDCECSRFTEDINRHNDRAVLVVNPVGGQGGGLPVTGSMTAPFAAAGALLLLAGGVGMALARRRRTRFVA